MAEDRVRITDESNDRKYFTITPRLVWALSTDTFDLALWTTVKMIAGDSGECYLSTEDLAEASMMSTGKCSQCRKRLIEVGLLEGEITKDEGYTQAVWHLRVPDLWDANVKWAQEHPKLRDMLAFKAERKASLHEMKPSPHEGKPSPHETKNIYKRRFNKEEEGPAALNPDVAAATELWCKQNPMYISPIVLEQVADLAREYSFEWFEQAITVAAAYNKAQYLPYIRGVLKDIHSKGGVEAWLQARREREIRNEENKRRNGKSGAQNNRRNGRGAGSQPAETEKERRTREAMEAIGSTYQPRR